MVGECCSAYAMRERTTSAFGPLSVVRPTTLAVRFAGGSGRSVATHQLALSANSSRSCAKKLKSGMTGVKCGFKT